MPVYYLLEDCRGNVILKSNNIKECLDFAKEELEDQPYETFFISKITEETVMVVNKDGIKE